MLNHLGNIYLNYFIKNDIAYIKNKINLYFCKIHKKNLSHVTTTKARRWCQLKRVRIDHRYSFLIL